MFVLHIEKIKLQKLYESLKTFQKLINNDCFVAQLDVNVFCTSENPPIHNLIFGSEKVALNHDESQLSLQTARSVTEITSQSIFVTIKKLF